MIALFATVLIASVIGSTHCAGMCGAFVAFAIGAGQPGARASMTSRAGMYHLGLLGLYQGGRLVTYVLLGVVAGVIGGQVDIGGHLVGVQYAAAILSGALMIGFGGITLARLAGVKLTPAKAPALLTRTVAAGHRRVMRYSPPVRALGIGLLTTLLPCGWLYAFVITAAGTGHWWSGGLVMGVFWLGTLPMLTVLGIGVRWLAAPLAAKLPAITASAVVVMGVYTIVARAGVTLHGVGVEKGSVGLARDVEGLDHTKAACCATKGAGGEVRGSVSGPSGTGNGTPPEGGTTNGGDK